MIDLSTRGRELLKSVLFAAIAAVVIGSLLPGDSSAMTAVGRLPLTDKALHCVAYFTLSFLATFVYRQTRTAIIFVFGFALMGATLELLQGLVPGRTPEVADECANIVGLLFGMILGLLGSYRARPGGAA